MGVPKFFRYISERYPCLSEIVKNYQIPEFDNLYLDMNGIIHMCSHPDDGDAHFRITEEQIFKDIFHYIEVLFRMIKPKKLFFMAVDGVAPRAKMNQQRGRRFNSAKLADKLEEQAKNRGEKLPSEARFDSNCITPGTEFMARLHEQLKYFVVHKISTDIMWSKCKVILSGHETPGEGEHKIMDYIRYTRAQPDYNPNTRHCLYGLDADLIMLGLCTHEPHFSLLREEVKFGKKSTKRKSVPEEITFYLLHLSLMREYLELEFSSLKKSLPFKFDIENIIDDWVLMGFLVGNDFIPHLPNLHIANGALPVLYNTYMKILPSLEGYINEQGTLNLVRFEKFMEALASVDMDNFTEHFADLKYFEAKTGRRPNETERTLYKPKDQDPNEVNLITFGSPAEKQIVEPSLENLDNLAIDLDVETEQEIADVDLDSEESVSEDGELMYEEFRLHKKDYYMNKLEYEQVTPEVLRDQAEGYVRAIQWNLNYYYNGCCSWSWYYPHHYAPYISDIKGFSNLKLEFDLCTPFKPYEQLLAVLPAASKSLLPECFQHLMTDESSPIRQYYPEDFKKDLNGKKQDWEAVVLVPFIDENLLLEAMRPYNDQLTPEEAARNTHRPMLVYSYSSYDLGLYESAGYFPEVKENHANCSLLSIEDIRVPVEKLVKGAYPGAKMDVYYPGFPTMKHLTYTGSLECAKVKVFEQPSRGDNMIIKLESIKPTDNFVTKMLGNTVYVGWPHLTEALVTSISDENNRYNNVLKPGDYNVEENRGHLRSQWHSEVRGVTEHYHNRLGVDVGNTTVLVHVKVLVGRKYIFTKYGRADLEKQWAEVPSCYPLQTVVRDIKVHDELFSAFRNVMDIFPVGSKCFMLGHPHYGSMGQVLDSAGTLQKGRLNVEMKSVGEPALFDIKELEREINSAYMPLYAATSQLAISKNVFSRITGTVFMSSRYASQESPQSKLNVGLNLKLNVKNLETPGYTRKIDGNWLYSNAAINLVRNYMELFPEVFEHLNFNGKNDVLYKEDVFPENSEDRTKELKEWLKKAPCSSVERQSSGSLNLDAEVVRKVEEIVDDFQKKQIVKTVLLQVKPHLLYKADIQTGELAPDPQASYQLLDRIINVRDGFTVPLGLKGTIIGINKSGDDTIYDIIFDQPFPGGLALTCSQNRGYKLPKQSMINLSYGLRQFHQKTGTRGQLTEIIKSQSNVPVVNDNSFKQTSLYNSTYPVQNSAFASLNNRAAPPTIRDQPIQSYSKPEEFPTVFTGQQNKFFFPQFRKESINQNRTNQESFKTDKSNSERNTKKPEELSWRNNNKNPPQNTNTPKQQELSWRSNNKYNPAEDLKRILKINDADNVPKLKETKITINTLFGKPNEKEAPVTSKSEEPYSMQLLSYYQKKKFGCPQYQYFKLPNNVHQAQIRLLSGEVILGEPSEDKEVASDNVARKALEVLNAREIAQSMPVGEIPPPPHNWVKLNQPMDTSASDNKSKTEKVSPDKKITPTKSDPSLFVPLQAVRKHVKNNSGNKQASPKNQSYAGMLKDSNRDSTVNAKEVSSSKDKPEDSERTEKRRERKMRIAANFNFANK